LLESELFGHEKGAFTGADARKLGRIELAARGTLFLDEIAEMPLALQAKMLRVLQDHRIQRLGGTREIQVDTRIVAATNRDLEREREAGRFRDDLYYRLNVFVIHIPPLRERPDDIVPLANHFIQQICAQAGQNIPCLSEEAMDVLRGYNWPGNARELRNVIERHLVLSNDELIGAEGLRVSLGHAIPRVTLPPAAATAEALSYQEARDQFERAFLVALLKRAGGNITAAAKAAGMSRRNLYEKIERFGLKFQGSKETEINDTRFS
jgi:DNA-binding NtrC family response regulator